jgi:mannose-1-phosphate guanylyltransferase
MIVVIIAGGSGTRLWPLSTPKYPKHLLKITDDRSLLQSTYDRAHLLSPDNQIYVVTEQGHAHLIKEQLPELGEDHFIIEPGRRNTASCLIAALHHLDGRCDHDEPIAFLSADHYIRNVDGFVHSFKDAAEATTKYHREVLVGLEPTYPSTGFGYIQKDGIVDESKLLYDVHSFHEKPPFEVAQEYVQSGRYLWNAGYYVCSINTLLKAMHAYSPLMEREYNALMATTDEASYRETYLGFENVAADYILNEKSKDLLVVAASFDWMDLGSFKDMSSVVEHDTAGNHVKGAQVELEDVQNSFVQNYEDKPVAVIGLDNVVVVNTPHGLLVARKDLSQKVGDVSKRFN